MRGRSSPISSASGTRFVNLATPPSSGSEGFIASFNPDFSLNWAVNTTDGSGNTFDDGVVNSLAVSTQGVVFAVGDDLARCDLMPSSRP